MSCFYGNIECSFYTRNLKIIRLLLNYKILIYATYFLVESALGAKSTADPALAPTSVSPATTAEGEERLHSGTV